MIEHTITKRMEKDSRRLWFLQSFDQPMLVHLEFRGWFKWLYKFEVKLSPKDASKYFYVDVPKRIYRFTRFFRYAATPLGKGSAVTKEIPVSKKYEDLYEGK